MSRTQESAIGTGTGTERKPLGGFLDDLPKGLYVVAHVVFLAGKPKQAGVERLAEVDPSPDRVVLAGADVYLQYQDGVQGSRLSAAQLERLLGVRATHRNWRTVAALAELAAGA